MSVDSTYILLLCSCLLCRMCHCASVLDTYALSMVQSSLISRPEKKEEKETFSGLGTREQAKIEAKIKRVDKYPW